VLFQQDGAPPHFHKEVTDFSKRKFPEKWIGRDRPLGHLVLLILLPSIFFSVGCTSRMPPLATTLPELPGRIEDAVATVTLELLNDV
jgi:hypothetical protein